MSFDYAGLHAVPAWFWASVAVALGAVVGSFLNVVIYRVPLGRSVVSPRSQCACGTPIAWYDNIPIISWFILRGRARCCGRAYSFRYAAVELLTGFLFLASWTQHPPVKAVVGMLFLSLLIVAFFIDLDHFIIPDAVSIGGAVIGVALSALFPALHGFASEYALVDAFRGAGRSLVGVLIGSGLVLWIALLAETLLRKEAMGFGDVKFVGMIGAFCGWPGAVFSIFAGAVIGTVWIALAWLWQRVSGRRASAAPRAETPDGQPSELQFGAHVPFGPMLALAAGLYFLWAAPAVETYVAELALLF